MFTLDSGCLIYVVGGLREVEVLGVFALPTVSGRVALKFVQENVFALLTLA